MMAANNKNCTKKSMKIGHNGGYNVMCADRVRRRQGMHG